MPVVTKQVEARGKAGQSIQTSGLPKRKTSEKGSKFVGGIPHQSEGQFEKTAAGKTKLGKF